MVFLLLHSGCVRKNSGYIPSEYGSLREYTFGSSFEAAWKASILALAEHDVIAIMDTSSGVLVTQSGSVDAAEITTLHTYITGQSYRYVYTVNLSEPAVNLTAVRVNVKLIKPAGLPLFHENAAPLVKDYLRARLFQGICAALAHSPAECDTIFASQAGAVTTALGETPAAGRTHASTAPRPDPLIMHIQQKLNDEGYDSGQVDGLMGSRTGKALREYQSDHDLPVTGRVTDRLLIALGLEKNNDKESGGPHENIEQPAFSISGNQLSAPAENLMRGKNADRMHGIIIESTEMKSQADPFSETVLSISGGSQVEILESSSSWARVKFDGQEGYVLDDLIRHVLQNNFL